MANGQAVYLPVAAKIISRRQESKDIFTLGMQFLDEKVQQQFQFQPGQFNMLYLLGVGEVPISIVSDPQEKATYAHTIRKVGRVTNALALLREGDQVGLRGPFGQGWPIAAAQAQDVLVITGGLGCAPSVSLINYIVNRRQAFGRLTILQGVKHSDELIFRESYNRWAQLPNTQVILAADVSKPSWTGYTGYVTELIKQIQFDASNTVCMICGPEMMMQVAIKLLLAGNMPPQNIYVNIERNMECALGHCGHCQLGGKFTCKNGPVYNFAHIQHLFGRKGF